MKFRLSALALSVLMTCGLALAQLPGDPPWRAGAEKFTTSDGVIYADGQPFLLIYDFTWSAEKDEKLYEFGEDWGNTATYGPVSANVSQPFDFGAMNSIYDAAALGHTFYTWSGSVAHQGRYLHEHPEAARVGPDGRRHDTDSLADRYHIRGIAYDRWGATQVANQLQGDGISVVSVGQGYASLSEPTKDLLAMVRGRRLRHNRHPVMDWCVGNAAGETDAADNVKPSKKHASDRMDGVVALVMAIALWLARKEGEGRSVYEDRDLVVLEF